MIKQKRSSRPTSIKTRIKTLIPFHTAPKLTTFETYFH